MTPERIAELRSEANSNEHTGYLTPLIEECLDEIERLQNITNANQQNWTIDSRYDELIKAVQRMFPNETRHQTALRYIRETEANATCPQAAACDCKP